MQFFYVRRFLFCFAGWSLIFCCFASVGAAAVQDALADEWTALATLSKEEKQQKFSEIFTNLRETLQKDLEISGLDTSVIETQISMATQEDKNVSRILIRRLRETADVVIDVLGDLHGDFGPIDALLKRLSAEGRYDQTCGKILDPTLRIIFLGDYIDRGSEGLKNLYYLTKLKMNNPQNIFLLRGNHEYLSVFFRHGFIDELASICPSSKEVRSLVESSVLPAFSLLPHLLFVDYPEEISLCGEKEYLVPKRLLFVHAGISHTMSDAEIEALQLALEDEEQNSWLHKIGSTKLSNYFVWNDINFSCTTPKTYPSQSRGSTFDGKAPNSYLLGYEDVWSFFQMLQISAMIRGHQQDSKIAFTKGKWLGIASSWPVKGEADDGTKVSLSDAVITLNAAPNGSAKGHVAAGFSTYGTLARLCKSTGLVLNETIPMNMRAQALDSFSGYMLEPFYFDPQTHEQVVPQMPKENP